MTYKVVIEYKNGTKEVIEYKRESTARKSRANILKRCKDEVVNVYILV